MSPPEVAGIRPGVGHFVSMKMSVIWMKLSPSRRELMEDMGVCQ